MKKIPLAILFVITLILTALILTACSDDNQDDAVEEREHSMTKDESDDDHIFSTQTQALGKARGIEQTLNARESDQNQMIDGLTD